MTGPDVGGSVFAALGLTADVNLTDDDVRAAWRRVATATHPDRADGGNPDRFAAAAAAYTELCTSYGRAEATAAPAVPARRALRRWRTVLVVPNSRPLRLGVRLAAQVAIGTVAVLAAGHGPAGPALAIGTVTWVLVTVLRAR